MPESLLWLVNHAGSTFSLGTTKKRFKQLENTWDDSVTVKRLAASHWCAWAIGHDHRVYIYVLSSDVPIRVPETIYENQRWSPFHGFSKESLLPTDRFAWSDESGVIERPKESVRLPSAHWKWEGDWLIDENLRGEVVDREGWQYAVDFPNIYTPEKHWKSFVRKRKWIRFRRFSSTDIWARISDVEVVQIAECFIDISVGGFLLPCQPAGFLSVWAVTNNGHVYARTDVNYDNPEGSSWKELNIVGQMGIINISIGASNLVWAITWDGHAVVRKDVSRNNIFGTDWLPVEYPNETTRLAQVSVGKNSVWALSREGQVWFRKGTSGEEASWNENSAVGTSWVEMVGHMSQISVSSNDQVFAIDMTSKTAYFRTAITRSDLTGKTWQPIILHEDLSALEQRGFLSEGAVCYCGELDKYCALHDDGRHRSSTTTSSSSTIMEYEEEDNLPSFYSLSSHLDATPPAWSHFVVEDDNVIFEQSDDSPPSPNDEQILCQVQSLAAYQIASNQTNNNKEDYKTNIPTKTTEESHDDPSLLASTLLHQSSDVLTAAPHSSSSSCQADASITSTSDVLTAAPHSSSSSCQDNASITSTSDVLTAAPHSSSSSCQENASITSTSDQSSEIVQCVSYENLALCKDISKPENTVTSDATLNSSISKLLMNIHSSLPTAVLYYDTNTQDVDKHFHNTLQSEATQNLKSLCPDLNIHSSLPTDVLCHETNTLDIDKHFHNILQGGETESLKSLCPDLKETIILDAPSSPSEQQSKDLQEKKSLRPQRKKLVSSSNDNDIVFERLKGKRKVRRKSTVSTENNVLNRSPSVDTQLASSDSQLSLDTYSFSFSLTNNSISSDSTSQGSTCSDSTSQGSTCSDSISQDSTCSDSTSQDSTSPVLNSQDPNSQPLPDLDVIDYLPPSSNYFTDIANFTGDFNMHSIPFLSVDYYSGETPLSEHQDIQLNSSQEFTNVSTPNVESVQTGLPANSDLVSVQTALPINSDLVSVQPAVIANGDVEYYSLTKDSHQLLSLDSNSSADDIINFATDIISEEEKSRQAIDFQPVIEYDVERQVTASQPSISSLTDSQVGVGDFDLTAVEFTNGQLRDYLPLAELHPSRKLSKYRKSPSLQSPVTKTEINTITQVSVAQPRLCWKWLDATSCVIDNPASVAWLSSTNKESEPAQKVPKISQSLRDDIMRKLVKRNEREAQGFKQLELAINRTTWVKKANMHMYRYDHRHHWVPCSVEFEQAITKNSEGCLTVHYQHKKTQKHTQIPLSEMTCVRTCFDLDQPSTLNIHTAMSTIIHQPLVLKANSENEADEWMGHLCAAKASVLNINNVISPGSIWSCTFTGDVFVSPASSTYRKSFDLCWGQHGGHMALVESGPSGVTWGIGFDKMPHVYNNGYGGAVTCGSNAMSDNTVQLTDYQHMYVYENEKWFPVVGWCCKGVFTDDFHWLTESGRSVASKDSVTLPSSKWEWTSDWTIDFSTPGGVDKNGWQYSNYLYGPFHARLHMRDSYRRRRWTRRCRLSYLGPWQTEDSLGLVDISVQIDPLDKDTDPVVVWAVGATGEVLYRSGVTSMQPMGQSWVHVATDMDKPFTSISIGGKYRVWGIASDGSAWFRTGVSPSNPAGTCWLLVVPPPECDFLLHQVSAGATTVWAVDTGDNLWHRQNITPTFPEGTGWEKVASRVKRVCVGPKDETWIITDALFSKAKHGPGVIYKRLGISPSKPTGTDWEVVIGSGWAHVSIRGLREDGNKSGNDEDSWD